MAKKVAGQEVFDAATTAGITATLPLDSEVTAPIIPPTLSTPTTPTTPTTITNAVDGGGYSGGGYSGGASGGTSDDTTEPSNKNLYSDVINAAQSKPEYTAPKDSSTGSAAAKGTQYSWDQKGLSDAQNQYQQDVLQAKQDALANRQTIEQNALQYQQQADMMKYTSNQEAEKVGWTGGYVLDQNRQMEYLKASIQAQMYGAMELQKYGYDSALSAARLSYDLNQKQFAHQYYQDAVNAALSEAQITGVYFSAETRDMMSQLAVAEQELGNLKNLNNAELAAKILTGDIKLTPEQQKALEVRKNITDWYKANGVSTTGIKTLAAWETEQAYAQQWADSIWQKYTAAMESAEKKIDEDVNTFIRLDAEGNPIFDGLSVSTINFKNLSSEEIIQYADSAGADGKDQVQTYMGHSIESVVTKTGTANADTLQQLISQDEKLKQLAAHYNGYEYTTQLDNYSITVNITENGEVTVTSIKTTSTSKNSDSNNFESGIVYSTDGIQEDEQGLPKEGYEYTFGLNSETVHQGEEGAQGWNDYVDLVVYDKNKASVKTYGVCIDWEYPTRYGAVESYQYVEGNNKEKWEATVNTLNTEYPNPTSDKLVIYNDELWYYSATKKCWGYLHMKGNNEQKLLKDLQSLYANKIPSEWK